MKQDNVNKKQEMTISLIKRLTNKQLTEGQYNQKSKFGTAEKRRLNNFYRKEGAKENG